MNFYIFPILEKKVQKIGYSGSFTTDNIPDQVLEDVSYGLTKLSSNGILKPGAAYKWDVKDGGKTYVFYIRRGQYFHNGKELTSKTLLLNFTDVERKDLDEYTVQYRLKEPYSPFLTLVSRPILAKNLSGLGIFKIRKIELNAGFVRYLSLDNKDNPSIKKRITFYPSQEALKAAFALGEVDTAIEVDGTMIGGSDVKNWRNVNVEEKNDYSQLITLFYNNEDDFLSNKKLRQALSYALPASFNEGERTYSPISPVSVYFSKVPNYGITSIEISKNLISDDRDIKKKTLEISTLNEFVPVADSIKEAWEKLGIKSKIKVVSELPRDFQILVYPIKLPQDPDQYTLWHSAQVNNITRYKNLRIDKLLEDGRSTTDFERRLNIYADFQKYIIDDVPASFLYFPKVYNISRK
jgi:peptide/nickel transport system substrate-binding protein